MARSERANGSHDTTRAVINWRMIYSGQKSWPKWYPSWGDSAASPCPLLWSLECWGEIKVENSHHIAPQTLTIIWPTSNLSALAFKHISNKLAGWWQRLEQRRRRQVFGEKRALIWAHGVQARLVSSQLATSERRAFTHVNFKKWAGCCRLIHIDAEIMILELFDCRRRHYLDLKLFARPPIRTCRWVACTSWKVTN